MKFDWKNKNVLLAVSAVIVFFTRLSFIFNGYGNDLDAWLVASAAKQIAETGEMGNY